MGWWSSVCDTVRSVATAVKTKCGEIVDKVKSVAISAATKVKDIYSPIKNKAISIADEVSNFYDENRELGFFGATWKGMKHLAVQSYDSTCEFLERAKEYAVEGFVKIGKFALSNWRSIALVVSFMGTIMLTGLLIKLCLIFLVIYPLLFEKELIAVKAVKKICASIGAKAISIKDDVSNFYDENSELGFFGATWKGMKLLAVKSYNSTCEFLKRAKDYADEGYDKIGNFFASPIINVYEWLVKKTKRLVNSRLEWIKNMKSIIKELCSNWWTIAYFVFVIGFVVFAGVFALFFLIPSLIFLLVFLSILLLVSFLISSLFVDKEKEPTDEQIAKTASEVLFDKGKESEEQGDYEAAQQFYELAISTSLDEDDKETYRKARDSVIDKLSNKEAEKMNDEGMAAYNRGEFEMAKEKFTQALGKCTSEYQSRQNFSNNWNKAMGKILNSEGKGLFNIGTYLQAIEKFRDAQRYQYDDENCNYIAECYYELGIKFYNQKNPEKAKQFYQKAVDECTRNYRNEEKFKASLRFVFSDIKNQEADEFYRAGIAAFIEQRFERAKVEFLKAFSHCTSDYKNKRVFKESADTTEAVIYNRNAIRLHSERKYHEAIKEHLKALKTIPRERVQELKKFKNDFASTYSEIGKNHLANEEFDEAKKYFELAIGETSDDFDKLEAIKNDLRKSEDGICNKSAEKLFKQGLELFASGDFEGARDQFSRAINLCTADYKNRKSFENNINRATAAIFNRDGNLLCNKEKYEGATELFKEAIKNLPAIYAGDLKIFKNNLAKAYNQHALQLLEALDYNKAKMSFILAIDGAREGGDVEAISSYKANLEMVKNAKEIAELSRKGSEMLEAENYEAALELFTKAVKICSENHHKRQHLIDNREFARAAIHHRDGLKYFYDQQFPTAIDEITKALEMLPKERKVEVKMYEESLTEAYNAHGDLLMSQKCFQPALNNYKKTISLSKTDGRAEIYENNRKIAQYEVFIEDGMNYVKLNKFDQAAATFRDAVNIFDTIGETRHNLHTQNLTNALETYAEMLLAEKKISAAVDTFELALQFASDDQKYQILARKNAARLDFLSLKWEAFLSEKKFDEALVMIDEALAISPSDDFTSQTKLKKASVLKELTQKLINDKNFEEAIDKIEQTRDLRLEAAGIFDERIAVVEFHDTIDTIQTRYLNSKHFLDYSEPAIRRLLAALEKLKNIDCLERETITKAFDIFLKCQAIVQAEKFIEGIDDEKLRKTFNECLKAKNVMKSQDERIFVTRQSCTNERILELKQH